VVQLAANQPSEKESAAFLTRSLNPGTEKDARVRAAALDGLKAFPPGAEDHVLGRIADTDWIVQIIAVRIVREKKLVRAIPALIPALERANLRMQEEIGAALREITGQNHESYADVWAKWWADNREKFQSQEAVKVGSRPKDPPVDNSIYGVPIKSDRVLFVIDISGSMLKPTQNPQAPTPTPKGPVTPKEGDPPPPPPPEEVMSGPKIDVAKHELKKAIQKLPKGAKFSMVAFNQGTLIWKEQPVDATPENRDEAYKWIRELKPSGSTYSEGALRVAFKIAGLGAIDKAYPDVASDTIMFISDGAPTDNSPSAAKLVPFEPIVALVREWNSQKRVVVNCIAVDMQPGNQFMETLARENGGIFVDR
jgi:von Willebrand factor type A domain